MQTITANHQQYYNHHFIILEEVECEGTTNSNSRVRGQKKKKKHTLLEPFFSLYRNFRKFCEVDFLQGFGFDTPEMMDEGKLPDRKIGSVKAAVSSFEGNPTIKKFQTNYHEKPYNKTRELHQAKRDTDYLKESRKQAESVIASAKSELSAAKKTVKDLTIKIEKSNSRKEAQMEKLKMERTKEGEYDSGYSHCEKVMRELELIKRDLSKLKLDMASVLEEKRRAENERELSLSKTESYLKSVEALNKEIEEINEEHVLVELARIEAIKEYEEIERQRTEKAEIYLASIDETRKKRQEMVRGNEDANELETKLAITVSDINVLESELKQVKKIDKGLERNEKSRYADETNIQEDGESGSVSLFESIMKELEATKKELTLVKEESFQFMSSMDVVRNELRHVADQTARLKKKEEKTEMNIQNLNSKLLRAKSKLEETSGAEDKAKSILSNLTLTLEQLKSETETAKKERSLISEETAVTRAEIQRTETEIDLVDERIQVALQDLRAVKSSEAIALENLKSLIEKTMRNRASASRPSSTITISKFEYDYLTGHAAGAKEIADKKVEAAQAWIEALKASEKELQIKSELLRRETREMRVEEEQKAQQTEASMNAEKMADEDDFEKWRQMMEPEKSKPKIGLPSKTMNKSIRKMTPTRRGKAQARRMASPLVRSTSFTVRRRKKVMPNLAKFFSGKSIERDL